LIRRFLQSDAIGRPQFVAAGLLLVYLLQCLWLVRVHGRQDVSEAQAIRIYYGSQQWKGGAIAGTPESLESEVGKDLSSSPHAARIRSRNGFDQDSSPLNYLIAAAPFAAWPNAWSGFVPFQELVALPYLFFGVMLGGSLWYVSRRLYGNDGGYIALVLYSFSPAMIANATGLQAADMGAVWGAFGMVFTAIAVAHTLYAPREVVLWNWRRILLLGLSLALAMGNLFSLVMMAGVALLFMLWVAPVRRGAVITIWSAAVALAMLMLFASYFFHMSLFCQGLVHAAWLNFEPHSLIMPISYFHVLQIILAQSPPLVIALPVSLLVFFSWKRARYFGNTAPLLVAVLLIFLAINAPKPVGDTFLVGALAFLFVFTAGILADLLETRYRVFVAAAVIGLLIASAAWNVLQLARSG
jgi:hypothetical protein